LFVCLFFPFIFFICVFFCFSFFFIYVLHFCYPTFCFTCFPCVFPVRLLFFPVLCSYLGVFFQLLYVELCCLFVFHRYLFCVCVVFQLLFLVLFFVSCCFIVCFLIWLFVFHVSLFSVFVVVVVLSRAVRYV
jgi:hypothetical protein